MAFKSVAGDSDRSTHTHRGRLYGDQLRVFLNACSEDEDFMLDLVEALLERYKWDDRRAQVLAELLRTANSAYKVKDSWDGLEMRVALGVKERRARGYRFGSRIRR